MDKVKIASVLEDHGFRKSNKVPRNVTPFQKEQVTIYVKNGNRLPIVIHPNNIPEGPRIAALPGVTLKSTEDFYHDSGMYNFPKRLNLGASEIHYGLELGVRDEAALSQLIGLILPSKVPDVFECIHEVQSSSLTDTEKKNLINARLGQGRFRELLLNDFQGMCAVSGVNIPEALRASHIKPWHLSSNKERLDPNNGLLLGVAYDALFDRYLISFSNDGEILISKSLPQDQLVKLGVNRPAKLTSLNADRLKYLEHHRKEFSVRESKTLSA